MRVPFDAHPLAQEALDSLGRTEDVRFSPGNGRLAIAGYKKNRIVVFDLERSTRVRLTGLVEVSSPHLDSPHGVDFLDDDTLVVANRTGNVVIFTLPKSSGDPAVRQSQVARVIEAGETGYIKSPGSVAVTGRQKSECQVLVCNNYVHTVSRHRLEAHGRYNILSNDLLLQNRLNIPDGLSVSADGRWIAVSNHGLHAVHVYENSPSLGPESEPVGILRQVYYPHGLRFSSDGGYVLVADAGSPLVHIYRSSQHGWWGVHQPLVSVRVLDQELYLQGRSNPQEGGPKGIDISSDDRLVAVTNEQQPLALFEFGAMTASVESRSPAEARLAAQEQVALEFYVQDQSREQLEAVYRSWSWRLTSPLRTLAEAWLARRQRLESRQ